MKKKIQLEPDPLQKKINLTELRITISELARDGYTEITVRDLILYMKGLAK